MNLKKHYLAFVLDATSHAAMVAAYPPKFAKVYAHHVTLAFNPTEADVAKFTGVDHVTVIDHVVDHVRRVECAVVEVNGTSRRPDGKTFHVTLSLTPPAKPVDSNAAIDDRTVARDPSLVLTGMVQLVPK